MNIENQYLELLQEILEKGTEKQDRTGTGTISLFGKQIRHSMSEGFPLLTTKKMAWKQIVTELLWFLEGETNIRNLVMQGNYIWVGDAFKKYYEQSHSFRGKDWPDTKEAFIERIKTDVEFANKWGELGPIYGKQWRDWQVRPGFGKNSRVDQIATIVNQLKEVPDSRRLIVNAWNVGELGQMVLPPCHYGFQVYTRELSVKERFDWCKHNGVTLDTLEAGLENQEDAMRASRVPTRAISLMWNQRSVDTFLGLPFNIASYGLLLLMIANEVNMVPDELIGNLGDTHIYFNHIEQVKEQLSREPKKLPKVNINVTPNEDHPVFVLTGLHPNQIELMDYEYHPTIKAPLSN